MKIKYVPCYFNGIDFLVQGLTFMPMNKRQVESSFLTHKTLPKVGGKCTH